MKTEELIQSIKQRDPILAKAVSGMIDYIQDSGNTLSVQRADGSGQCLPTFRPY